MSLIWTPRTRTSQPQGVVGVDWGNPLTRGALLSVNYANSGRNLINNKRADIQLGVRTPAAGVFGVWDSSYGAVADDRFTLSSAVNDFALVAVVDATASIGATVSVMDSDASGLREFQFRFNSTNQLEFIRFNTSGTPHFCTLPAPTRWGAVVAVSIGGSMWVAFNGAVSGAVAIGGTPKEATRVSLGNTFGFGGVPANSESVKIFAAHVLSGSAVIGAMRALSINPWQLFAPTQQPIYFAASAGGLPTLSAAQMTGITTTGGYPRVSYVY